MSTNAPTTRLAEYEADAVYEMFAALSSAPTLTGAAASGFESGVPLTVNSIELFDILVSTGVIRVEIEWTARINAYRQIRRTRKEAVNGLPDVERQLRTISVQLKHSAEKRDRGRLLKSKTTRWEETNQHEKLEKEQQRLTEERLRFRAVIEGADEALDELVTAIGAVPDLTKARWYGERVLRVTNDGAFLASTLKSMNKAHFRGRRLCDVLVVGPLLA